MTLVIDSLITGVVVGALTKEGLLNMDQLVRMRDAAQGMLLTFHRAIDVCKNPFKSLMQLQNIGFDRVLTSGLESSALKGILNLNRMVGMLNTDIRIIAAAGINADNVSIVITGSNVHGVHAGSSVTTLVTSNFVSQSSATMGTVATNVADDMSWSVCDMTKVSTYVKNAEKAFFIAERNRNIAQPVIHEHVDVYPSYC
jgi:copper homeostasis protein CutC